MEQLDALAGSIAYKHVLGPSVPDLVSGGPSSRGFYLVTASVDRWVCSGTRRATMIF